MNTAANEKCWFNHSSFRCISTLLLNFLHALKQAAVASVERNKGRLRKKTAKELIARGELDLYLVDESC